MPRGCRLDPKNPDFIASPEAMLGQFYAELMTLVPAWKQRLLAHPEDLPELEREVHIAFQRGADLVVTGLISWVMQQAAFAEVMNRVKRESTEFQMVAKHLVDFGIIGPTENQAGDPSLQISIESSPKRRT